MNSKLRLPQAVCLLMLGGAGVFAVSRRNDDTQWGMPGGKVDPGETPVQAVIREISEEISLDIEESQLDELYVGPCGGENGTTCFEVTTYLYLPSPPALEALKAEEGLALEVQPFSVLLRPDSSPFAEYNQRVFNAYRLRGEAGETLERAVAMCPGDGASVTAGSRTGEASTLHAGASENAFFNSLGEFAHAIGPQAAVLLGGAGDTLSCVMKVLAPELVRMLRVYAAVFGRTIRALDENGGTPVLELLHTGGTLTLSLGELRQAEQTGKNSWRVPVRGRMLHLKFVQ
jgi:8-oxo-dGTP diphosphatase